MKFNFEERDVVDILEKYYRKYEGRNVGIRFESESTTMPAHFELVEYFSFFGTVVHSEEREVCDVDRIFSTLFDDSGYKLDSLEVAECPYDITAGIIKVEVSKKCKTKRR